jgi:tRNA-Thr(GGU) m(6)t(6)A37 methyltransferase TsaA
VIAEQDLRPDERATDRPLRADAALTFIGSIRTPWTRREDCPRQGRQDGPECRLVVEPPWDAALDGLEAGATLEVLYWLHRSRRDLLTQSPAHLDGTRGTFALRSPARPNPIGSALVRLERREGAALVVRGFDCLDGTPLLDIKPERCGHSAAPEEGREQGVLTRDTQVSD